MIGLRRNSPRHGRRPSDRLRPEAPARGRLERSPILSRLLRRPTIGAPSPIARAMITARCAIGFSPAAPGAALPAILIRPGPNGSSTPPSRRKNGASPCSCCSIAGGSGIGAKRRPRVKSAGARAILGAISRRRSARVSSPAGRSIGRGNRKSFPKCSPAPRSAFAGPMCSAPAVSTGRP